MSEQPETEVAKQKSSFLWMKNNIFISVLKLDCVFIIYLLIYINEEYILVLD